MGVNRDTITLHIEELVLDGFPPASRHAIGDAVQAELVRLLAEHGIADIVARGGRDPVIDGGSITLPARADVRTSGASIARRVHAALSQRGERNERT